MNILKITPELTFEEYRDYLQQLALRLTGDNNDAQDLVQDTLLKAYEHANSFRGEAAVKTWLTKILVNTFLTQKRKKKDHVSIALDTLPAPDWSANPEKIIVKRELQWCINHTLTYHLPQRYGTALALREFEGMSYKDIAGILEISPGTAKVLVFRSRRAFRRHLEKSGCFAYVRDYNCVCDGVRDGLLPC
ncbi:MAG: RNA polymerase sigma factor [Clostridiales bacterium]|jgi:RNA polymerase sigma-70 factor (ECF subfamily)|nr:RNA polymerase sigma factor [Clostridiales bacterium]